MKHGFRLAFTLAFLALVGCGSSSPPRTPVKGKVTIAGKDPLPGGIIQFVLASDTKVIGGGQIKPDGSYEVPDAPVGECKVVIDNEHLRVGGKTMGPVVPGKTTTAPPGETKKKMNAAPMGLETPTEDTSGTPKYLRIDSSYQKAETTPLLKTVSRNEDVINLEVK